MNANANANNSGGNRRRSTTPATNSDAPLLNPIASTPVGAPVAANNSSGATADTSHAFTLLKEKQYEAALKEARQITDNNPNDSEGWKIAGFAELNLKQYEAASTDLQKAFDLQRTARQEDPFTSDALAHAYFLSDKFDRALPLLVAATTRKAGPLDTGNRKGLALTERRSAALTEPAPCRSFKSGRISRRTLDRARAPGLSDH